MNWTMKSKMTFNIQSLNMLMMANLLVIMSLLKIQINWYRNVMTIPSYTH